MGFQAYQKVLTENWQWYTFSDVMTLKGQGHGQTIKFKVKLKNSQNGQKSHKKGSGDVNMQIVDMTFT